MAIKLSDRERIMAAYAHAADEGSGVLIEQFVAGHQTRLLVVGNRVVAASAPSPKRSSATACTRSASWSTWPISIRGGAKNYLACRMSKMKLDAPALVELRAARL